MGPRRCILTQSFLDRLMGEWTFEGHEVPRSEEVRTGVETVTRRGAWVVIESDDGARFQLAFDPETGRVGGDFISWEYPTLWTYDGAVEGDRLVLTSRGPRMDGTEGETEYQDIWEIVSSDERRLTGRVPGADGHWRDFTTTSYRRRLTASSDVS